MGKSVGVRAVEPRGALVVERKRPEGAVRIRFGMVGFPFGRIQQLSRFIWVCGFVIGFERLCPNLQRGAAIAFGGIEPGKRGRSIPYTDPFRKKLVRRLANKLFF